MGKLVGFNLEPLKVVVVYFVEIKRIKNELQDVELRRSAATEKVQPLLGGTVPSNYPVTLSTRKSRPKNKIGVEPKGKNRNIWSMKQEMRRMLLRSSPKRGTVPPNDRARPASNARPPPRDRSVGAVPPTTTATQSLTEQISNGSRLEGGTVPPSTDTDGRFSTSRESLHRDRVPPTTATQRQVREQDERETVPQRELLGGPVPARTCQTREEIPENLSQTHRNENRYIY